MDLPPQPSRTVWLVEFSERTLGEARLADKVSQSRQYVFDGISPE